MKKYSLQKLRTNFALEEFLNLCRSSFTLFFGEDIISRIFVVLNLHWVSSSKSLEIEKNAELKKGEKDAVVIKYDLIQLKLTLELIVLICTNLLIPIKGTNESPKVN